MSLLGWVLALIGTILVYIGAFNVADRDGVGWHRANLCWLGTALVFTGAFVLPHLHL